MPESLKQSEVNSKTDPSVAKQFDTETSSEEKFKDLYELADKMKISMLSTYRNGVGVSISCHDMSFGILTHFTASLSFNGRIKA